MKTVYHSAESRGKANHGWLNSNHTFSFANYYNPERMSFGVLRVLNDDIIQGGSGFGTHPHKNMEIISIPIFGSIAHKDSMGNTSVIKDNEIQVMSAGNGVQHSEFNASPSEDANFLQIWIIPNKKDVTPRYEQIEIKPNIVENKFGQLLSPAPMDDSVWIHQDAWFHLGKFKNDFEEHYVIKKGGNGLYIFVIEGEVEVGGQKLSKRDGFGIWETKEVNISVKSNSQVLLMEVPMK